MTVATDFTIDNVDKKISHTANAVVYTVNEFYTWLQDSFDELSQLDDDIPMSAQTPTSYTMINGWYIEEECLKYLNGGAIQTTGYQDEIHTVEMIASGYVSFIPTDIGKVLLDDAGAFGTILDYDNAARKVWTRTGTATVSAASSVITTTAGTGAGTQVAAPSTTGETIFGNAYTLGTLDATNGTPQLYIYQNSEILANAAWFSTGHFDILVKITESGVDIDAQKITVFGRQWGDSYTHFEITLTTAGQNAVPLGTADDVNVTSLVAAVQAIADTDIGGDVATGVNITVSLGAYTGIDVDDNGVTETYDVQIDCNNERLADVYEVCKWATRSGATSLLGTDEGQEYISANPGTYAEVVVSPFGTFAGGKFFGARGVYFINVNALDIQNFQTIDAANAGHTPPNYQAFNVENVLTTHNVAVYESTGASSTTPLKTQYTLIAGVNALNILEVTAAVPKSTPTTGTIIVTDAGVETAYAYTAVDNTLKQFTVVIAGSTYSGGQSAFVPYIYQVAGATTVSETSTIYTTPIDVVAVVREQGYLPNKVAGSYSATGFTANSPLTADSIYNLP